MGLKLFTFLFCFCIATAFATDFGDISATTDVTTLWLAPTQLSNTAYDITTWDGVTTVAPSKNALRDYFSIFDTDGDGKVNVLDQAAGIANTNSSGVLQTPITDNSTNWDTAYTDRLKWDGGATGLTAATGRTSLGLAFTTNRVTAQSAANSSITTVTNGGSDASFYVSMNMNVTSATAISTSLNCNYTDESSTARTMIFPVTSLSGTFLTNGLIITTGAFETPVMHIRCKASTAITLYTATGTFTLVTYTAEGIIKQIP